MTKNRRKKTKLYLLTTFVKPY